MPSTNERRQPIGTATYKGRSYAILFAGETKYGNKLKLAFPDNLDQEFWIARGDATRVEFDDNPAGDDAAWNERRRDQRPRHRQRQPDDETVQFDPTAAPFDRGIDQDAPPEDDSPSYCASCGQLLPGLHSF